MPAPDSAVPFLSLRHVHKNYPDHQATIWLPRRRIILEDLSFDLERGSILGILGESGSGKSTLARLILGLEKPDSGQILFEGQEGGARRAGHRGRISVVFQDYSSSVNPGFRVADIIAEGLAAGARPRSAWLSEIPALMARVQVPPELAGRLPHQLSGGQLQRVCIARALASKPDFIVFDEAISSLDLPIQARILTLLREIRGNMSYIFITHDIQMATLLCDQILLLRHGKVDALLSTQSGLGQSASPCLRQLLASTVIFHSNFEAAAETASPVPQ